MNSLESLFGLPVQMAIPSLALFPLALFPLAILIGVVLGSLGSGGAILSLPILVYVALLPVRQAVAVSQIVIGVAALVGSLLQMRSGRVVWSEVLLFGLVGIPCAQVGILAARLIEPNALMMAFSIVMVGSGLRMIFTAGKQTAASKADIRVSLLAGCVVGFLTGLLGVGGGFLLVPSLIAFSGLDARRATATSLPVIAINTLTGAVAQRAQWSEVLGLALGFLAATLVGTFIGLRLGRSASESKLKQALGGLMVLVGVLVGALNAR